MKKPKINMHIIKLKTSLQIGSLPLILIAEKKNSIKR